MAQKKETTGKKGVKMQDLAPRKDAKGGAARSTQGSSSLSGLAGGGSLQSKGSNLTGGGSLQGKGGSLDRGSSVS